MHEAEQAWLPVLRHLILAYPDDPRVVDLKHEFMLGSELLAAPVCNGARRLGTPGDYSRSSFFALSLLVCRVIELPVTHADPIAV